METKALVAFLSDPASWPEKTSHVRVVETHMAFVFLTDRHAWKLKKPVRYDFLDFSTPARRRWACSEEVRLNRRLAPHVYLGIVAVARDDAGTLRIANPDDPDAVDWLVSMTRLPADLMLDALIRAGGPSQFQLEGIVAILVPFYRTCARSGESDADYVQRVLDNIRSDTAALRVEATSAAAEQAASAGTALMARMIALGDELAARASTGRIVEGHGDLRPEHICLDDPPAIIDCLEFRRDFRMVDPADELAFLAMECDRLGAPQMSDMLLTTYRCASGDDVGESLFACYAGARALLRAKLALWHLRDGDADTDLWTRRVDEYLQLAVKYTELSGAANRPSAPPVSHPRGAGGSRAR